MIAFLKSITDYWGAYFTGQAFKAHLTLIVTYILANYTPEQFVEFLKQVTGYDIPYQLIALVFAVVASGGVYAIPNKK